jgi:alpha-1,2-mannosyltransferase
VALPSSAWLRKAGLSGAGHRRRPSALTIGAWALALGAIGYLVFASVTDLGMLRMADLMVYRGGGRSIAAGGALYSMRADSLLFTYPPAAAILAMPLALLPAPLVMAAWVPMVYVPLGIVIWFSFRPLLARAGNRAPAAFALLLGGCALLTPLRQEIHYGQIDIFLVALCLLDCAVPRPRWPRGVLIGVATAIKLVPGVFIIYLLITGRRKAAAVAAGTFAASSGLAWLIAPKDSTLYWTSAIFNSRRLGPNGQAANQSLRGMLMRLFYPHVVPALLWLSVAAIVAIAGFAAARAAHRRGQELAGIAITGMLAALLSPVAWIHHLCWIVIALGVIIGDGRNWRRVYVAAAIAVGYASVLPIWGKDLWYSHAAPAVVSRTIEDSFGIGALIIIAVLFRLRRGGWTVPRPRTEPQPTPSLAVDEGKMLAGSRE